MIRRSERLHSITNERITKATIKICSLTRTLDSFNELTNDEQCLRLIVIYKNLSFYFFEFIDIHKINSYPYTPKIKSIYQIYNESFRLLREMKNIESQGYVSYKKYVLIKKHILKYRKIVENWRNKLWSIDSWSVYLPPDIINYIFSYVF